MAGALVVLEGIDQAGKMTQARAVQERLQQHGLACAVRHYPDYDTAIGKVIGSFLTGGLRLDPRARCMLFAANRWEKDAELRALRDAHALTLVDRYTWSNVVYGLSQGVDEGWLRGLEAGLLQPDATLLIDISPAESRRRKAEARDDYERDERLLEAARSRYRRFAGELEWVVVDGEAETAVVTGRVVTALRARLGAGWPVLQPALR